MQTSGMAKRCAIVIATMLALSSPMRAQSGHELFQQAIAKERAEGKLQDAIALYLRVVETAGADHALAAKALLQLGGCYEKLRNAEARTAYERLIARYPDQTDLVAQARARLAAIVRNEPVVTSSAQAVVAMPRVDVVNDVQALSPDGAKALFMSYDKGQNVAIFDFSTRQAKLLTEFDWSTTWTFGGAWSPDGQRVAYMQTAWRSDAVAELRVATLTGDSRVIFRNEANPGKPVVPADWLPDGRTILARLQRADGTAAIGLVSSAGGPFTPLRSFSWTGRPSRPRVSPDGRFVAFAEGTSGMQDLYVLTIDGRTAYRITEHPGDDIQPLWSPDGRHMAFLSTRLGVVALWAVPMKDGQTVGQPVRVRDGMQGTELIEWTKRGIVYVERTQTHDIYLGSTDPSTVQPAGDARLLPYSRTGRNSSPVWSPDGRFMAFVSGSPAEPDRRHLVVLPEGRGDAREYLIPTTRYTSGQDPYDLRWFGDGSGLGFSGTDRQGAPTVFRLSLASGEWKTYPSPVKTWTRLEWNGDGTTIFYAQQDFSGEGQPGIVERNLATNVERDVYKPSLDRRGAFRGLRLGPDRRSLAFTVTTLKNGIPTLALIVVNVENGQARTLVEEVSGTTMDTSIALGAPAWSADGASVIVARTVGSNQWPEFRVVGLDGTITRSFALDKSLAGRAAAGSGQNRPGIREAVWSPDGMGMAFVVTAFRNDTWLIGNALAAAGPAAAAAKR